MTVGSPYAPPFEIAVTAYMPENGTYAPPTFFSNRLKHQMLMPGVQRGGLAVPIELAVQFLRQIDVSR